ncbi:transforming acidic coiled-coil protein isoform X4 [Musca autumnalis]|uniref:transforming acidic coiled-coil protein isoform X4 n=1 Tax=Musca autumnalis TaxID=221902 RepID=UPI003CE938AA
MEFISNLIKRPVSLVGGGGAAEATEKPQESTSRPTTIGSFENDESLPKELNSEKQQMDDSQKLSENLQKDNNSQTRTNSTSRPTTIGSLEEVEILQKDLSSLSAGIQQMENTEILQKELQSLTANVVDIMEGNQQNVTPIEKSEHLQDNKGEENLPNSDENQNVNKNASNCDVNQGKDNPKDVLEVKSEELSENNAEIANECGVKQTQAMDPQSNVEVDKIAETKKEGTHLQNNGNQNNVDEKQPQAEDMQKDISKETLHNVNNDQVSTGQNSFRSEQDQKDNKSTETPSDIKNETENKENLDKHDSIQVQNHQSEEEGNQKSVNLKDLEGLRHQLSKISDQVSKSQNNSHREEDDQKETCTENSSDVKNEAGYENNLEKQSSTQVQHHSSAEEEQNQKPVSLKDLEGLGDQLPKIQNKSEDRHEEVPQISSETNDSVPMSEDLQNSEIRTQDNAKSSPNGEEEERKYVPECSSDDQRAAMEDNLETNISQKSQDLNLDHQGSQNQQKPDEEDMQKVLNTDQGEKNSAQERDAKQSQTEQKDNNENMDIEMPSNVLQDIEEQKSSKLNNLEGSPQENIPENKVVEMCSNNIQNHDKTFDEKNLENQQNSISQEASDIKRTESQNSSEDHQKDASCELQQRTKEQGHMQSLSLESQQLEQASDQKNFEKQQSSDNKQPESQNSSEYHQKDTSCEQDTKEQSPMQTLSIESQQQQQHEERPLSSLTSSLNGNITDFIGVPEEILKEFDEEYLPPPPPALLLPPDDYNNMQSVTPSPPPPPPALTSSMTASQTIDELLSEITDNLTLAGINDEVLAIASPPQKSEHSPLSSKSSLNNSKSIPKTPTNNNGVQQTAAGTAVASPAVFEANSTIHKFHVDPELATGLFDDHQHQQTTAAELQNTSGVTNTSSNKFVGLTEFDEAKIPELPGDLNPNIEEQYNVTFEECFIPTLTAKLSSKELPIEKTHFLLPNETTDNTSMSSANETFADCQDGNDDAAAGLEDKDPLATTFAEQPTLNTTVEVGDGECFESALQDDFKDSAVGDITMDAGGNQTQVTEEIVASQPQIDLHPSLDYEEEPMDVDMNATMEMIQNSAQNIENVEKAIQQAEHILQNLEGPTQPIASATMRAEEDVKIIGSIARPTESSKMLFVVNPANVMSGAISQQHLEMEKSNHDISLNKSIELPLNKSRTLSSECVITTVNNDCETVEAGVQETLNVTKESQSSTSADQKNLTINAMNTSNSISVSCKSPTSKLNLTTSISSSTGSLKSSAPNSPSFPIKNTTNGSSFPQSPKLKMGQSKPTFLEKSDYVASLESKTDTIDVDSATNMNGTFVQPSQPVKNKNRLTFGLDQPSAVPATEADNKRLTYTIDESSQSMATSNTTDNKRLTFNVQSEEVPSQLDQPTQPAPESKAKQDSRRTFNISHEESTPMDTSYAAMDVDDNLPQNATMAIDPRPNSPALNITKPVASAFNETITRSQSPPLPTLQQRSQSPALQNQTITLPTMQKRSNSPPLPTMQRQQRSQSPSLPPTADMNRTKCIANESSESLHFIQKRPSIHRYSGGGDVLSEKEQSNIKMKDEKDIYYEKSTPSPMDEVFTAVSATSTTLTNTSGFSAFEQNSPTTSAMNRSLGQQIPDDEFQGNSNLILNPSDFDYLLTKGNNNTPVDRSSLLLKFDPLLGCPIPVNQGQQAQQQLNLQIPTNLNNNPCLSPTIEEDELNESTNRSFVVDNTRKSLGGSGGVSGFGGGRSSVTGPPALSSSAKLLKERSQEVKQQLQQQQQQQHNKRQLPQPGTKNATMSVDVIKDMSLDNNDCNKTFENSNSTQPDDKQINYKMDELEKKVKNEVLKTEDIEKKLREAELREEALIKRITEKDKTVAKMTGVIEAYEKAIAELIAEKEQLIQNYEKQLAEVKADRDSNYHHLTSLETTFSDLHVKYEKSKEMTCQLKGNEENLIAENRKNAENLRLQEQRYDKMKNHAMQQLEIANKKLEALAREHQLETTKLKALLKKEEIARSSMSEQLAQKAKENAELVKICDELISGQGS